VVVNNAATHPDGFSYETAQHVLDVNFFGAQNMIRRLVPARWPEAYTGRWLGAKSGYKGMRQGGCIVNIGCGSSFAVAGELSGPFSLLRQRFDACATETAIVMLLTDYLGQVAADSHIQAGWPSNPYLVSKVALQRLSTVVQESLESEATKRYEPCITCLSVDPGWMRTRMGGPDAAVPVEEAAKLVVSRILAALHPP
jgi:NAD(P)-dependent dehydrogenase (short-subunit alcohol dehydrogenase family)